MYFAIEYNHGLEFDDNSRALSESNAQGFSEI